MPPKTYDYYDEAAFLSPEFDKLWQESTTARRTISVLDAKRHTLTSVLFSEQGHYRGVLFSSNWPIDDEEIPHG